MFKDIAKIYITEEELKAKVIELGHEIEKDYEDKKLIVVCILRGSFVFFADLVRNIKLPILTDFMSISSYGDSTVSSGIVKIKKDIDYDISDSHVLVVEDIVDSGLTLKYLVEYINKHNPASVKTCVLLDKPSAHSDDINLDYVGFEIGNEFVVGYGLDYAQKYRNLPFIGVLKEEIYFNE